MQIFVDKTQKLRYDTENQRFAKRKLCKEEISMDKVKLAERLRLARGNTPMRVICKELNISASALSMYESGDRVPRDEVKEKMANLYKTTVGKLFFNE